MDYLKKMLKSKTVWLGLAQIVTALGLYFTGEANIQELFMAPTGILTILFRIITTTKIDDK